MELVQQMNDKVIVFTEYRELKNICLSFSRNTIYMAVPYRGGMNRGKKDWMMDLFRRRAQIMVATEAGGEGINLQFCQSCHQLRSSVEPYAGRTTDRPRPSIRTNEDVQIYNLCTLGTIEEHIVHLLHEKINMFELVIGELDDIIQQLEKEESLERRLAKMVLESTDGEQLRQRIDGLGDTLLATKNKIHRENQP